MLQLSAQEVWEMKKWLLAIVACFMLGACSEESQSKTADELQDTIEKGTVGYEIVDGKVEAAEDVPEDVQQEIFAALKEYIDAFNNKDLERFKQTVSQQDETYYTETMKEAETVFEQYSLIERETKDETVLKYDESRVEVFLNVTGRVVEAATETEMAATARQVIVMVKEDDAWKVASVHSINI